MTTTASGLGFAGGGDGVLRAFSTKTGKVLWTFQTGHQIAAGPTIYSVNGKEYVAISSGGSPTSSGGGTASELQVFALGAIAEGIAAARSPGSCGPRRSRSPPPSPAPRPPCRHGPRSRRRPVSSIE